MNTAMQKSSVDKDQSPNQMVHMHQLRKDLQTAVLMGNYYREPVRLCYHDHRDKLVTKIAVVIALTERYAILQGGKSIQLAKMQKVTI